MTGVLHFTPCGHHQPRHQCFFVFFVQPESVKNVSSVTKINITSSKTLLTVFALLTLERRKEGKKVVKNHRTCFMPLFHLFFVLSSCHCCSFIFHAITLWGFSGRLQKSVQMNVFRLCINSYIEYLSRVTICLWDDWHTPPGREV